MRLKFKLLVLITLPVFSRLISQNRLAINVPSAKNEAEYIWSTIQDINFFEEHNYQISLPEGELIEQLKEKAKSGRLTDADYEKLEDYVTGSVYNEEDYFQGHRNIQDEIELIQKMINQIDASKFNWNFKAFESYQVNLTLYGPGGSYQPEDGSLLIFTTPEGQFKNYRNPANIIIHEIVHIGIEESIISKHNVPHAFKERIVDIFVSLNFGHYLPEYIIQDMGDIRLDKFVKQKSDLIELEDIVERILSEK